MLSSVLLAENRAEYHVGEHQRSPVGKTATAAVKARGTWDGGRTGTNGPRTRREKEELIKSNAESPCFRHLRNPAPRPPPGGVWPIHSSESPLVPRPVALPARREEHSRCAVQESGVLSLPGCKLACYEHEFCGSRARSTEDGVPVAAAAAADFRPAERGRPPGARRRHAGHPDPRPGAGRAEQVVPVPAVVEAARLHERYELHEHFFTPPKLLCLSQTRIYYFTGPTHTQLVLLFNNGTTLSPSGTKTYLPIGTRYSFCAHLNPQ